MIEINNNLCATPTVDINQSFQRNFTAKRLSKETKKVFYISRASSWRVTMATAAAPDVKEEALFLLLCVVVFLRGAVVVSTAGASNSRKQHTPLKLYNWQQHHINLILQSHTNAQHGNDLIEKFITWGETVIECTSATTHCFRTVLTSQRIGADHRVGRFKWTFATGWNIQCCCKWLKMHRLLFYSSSIMEKVAIF